MRMPKGNRCRVCKSLQPLNDRGVCDSCEKARTASRLGTSYGKLEAAQYEKEQQFHFDAEKEAQKMAARGHAAAKKAKKKREQEEYESELIGMFL